MASESFKFTVRGVKLNPNAQSVPVPGTEGPGHTAIYRSALSPQALSEPGVIIQAKTMYDVFLRGLKISRNKPFLGTRTILPNGRPGPFNWETYSQISKRIDHFGSGVVQIIGKELQLPNKNILLGLYSVNRAEWLISDYAAAAFNMATVSLYDTLGADTLEYIINHAELPIVVTSIDKIPDLLKVSPKTPTLKAIICMDDIPFWKESKYQKTQPNFVPKQARILREWATERNIKILTFKEIEEIGSKNIIPHNPVNADGIYTICYTSGTTGVPKGAVLTARNFISAIDELQLGLLSNEDVMISYLPLAHCFDRLLEIAITSLGGAIGYYRGDVLKLLEDIQELKPTIFPSVPRLFNKIYSKVKAQTLDAGGIRGPLFQKAFSDKLYNLNNENTLEHFLWDRVLFNRIKAVIGGRVRYMISGSAPISEDVLTFLRIAFSCEVLEGYGATECAAACSISLLGDYSAGHVGVPVSGNEIKLVDVPEMNYLSTDKPFPRGEICVRGYNVFQGYYKDEEKTREALDPDGWLRTGDIGLITERGNLKIIDRKKNLFKLSQGEYVAPEKIENIYTQYCPLVSQIFVYGDSLQSELVSIIVIDPEQLFMLVNNGTAPETLPTAEEVDVMLKSNYSRVKEHLLSQIAIASQKARLAGFEQVKNIYVESVPFSVDNDLLTPTFKIKRPQAKEYYKDAIDTMYRELNSKGRERGFIAKL